MGQHAAGEKAIERHHHSSREYDGYSVGNVALETTGLFLHRNLIVRSSNTQTGVRYFARTDISPLGRMRPEQHRCVHRPPKRHGLPIAWSAGRIPRKPRTTIHWCWLQTERIRALDYLCSLPEVDEPAWCHRRFGRRHTDIFPRRSMIGARLGAGGNRLSVDRAEGCKRKAACR